MPVVARFIRLHMIFVVVNNNLFLVIGRNMNDLGDIEGYKN